MDATGAGDAFFAAALVDLSGDPGNLFGEERVREAPLRVSAASALARNDYRATRALLTKDELKRFMGGGG